MAGHSKWSQIKRSKAIKDAKKGANFAKLSKDIQIAAKLGGPDLNGNFRLRTAVEKAKEAAMPSDNIKRAIEKGSGTDSTEQLEYLAYEGYGPGGVAIYIEAMTDNRNRTAGDIRSYFNKYGGNLGTDGSVAWMFEEKGLITLNHPLPLEMESLLELVLEAGADDLMEAQDDTQIEITCPASLLNQVCQTLQTRQITIHSAENTRNCATMVTITQPEQAKPLMKLLMMLEDHDDVQQVYANVIWSDTLEF